MLIMYFPGQQSFDGFALEPWFQPAKKIKTTTVNLRFSEDKGKLSVTVDNALEDDINTEKLLIFLKEKNVIDNVAEWQIEKKSDTEGLTFTEEEFTTLEFNKSLVA